MLTLYIGNKNYSSWSMRPWVLLRQVGIDFQERLVRFDSFEPGSNFKQEALRLSPAGKVPVLDDDGLFIWDSLAIAEYLAEKFPDLNLWPTDPRHRARARSVCADMHSGFGALRQHCPMNIEAHLPEIGERVLGEQPAVVSDVERIQALWCELLAQHQGPLLFGAFSIADAFFAPVVMRLKTYAIPVRPEVARYMEALLQLGALREWIGQALDEHDFRPCLDPYRNG